MLCFSSPTNGVNPNSITIHGREAPIEGLAQQTS